MTHDEDNPRFLESPGKLAAATVALLVAVPVAYVWAGPLVGTIAGVVAFPLVVGFAYAMLRRPGDTDG